MTVYKVKNGIWRDISKPDERLDIIEERQLISKAKSVIVGNNSNSLTSDKINVIVNIENTSALQDEIFSRCLELTEKELKIVLARIKLLKSN